MTGCRFTRSDGEACGYPPDHGVHKVPSPTWNAHEYLPEKSVLQIDHTIPLGLVIDLTLHDAKPGFEEFIVVDPSGAVKADVGKSRVDLIPTVPLLQTGDVFAYGAAKYSERNWEKGFAWSRIHGALLRHLFAWWSGEKNDPESGLPHLAHANCCLLMLMEFDAKSTGTDDRPKG